MLALAKACAEGRLAAEVGKVVAASEDSPALCAARDAGLPVEVASGSELVDVFKDCELVCLAGYLRLLPSEVLADHPNRVLNIHPSLLPKFGGKGMYGLRVHQAVLDAGETVSGCTVHLVSEQYDEGRILLQRTCPVLKDDSAETLAQRVLALEHEAYPEAISRILVAHG